MRVIVSFMLLVFFALVLFILPSAFTPSSAENGRKVYVIPIQDRRIFMVDIGQSSFVRRAVEEAERDKAEAIILKIKTFGGRVDAAVEIKDILFETDIKTIAFVEGRAISAGALIALCCQSIVMSPGSSIGAATPVSISPVPSEGKPQPTGEKEVSFVRAEFKSTAERNHHPAKLAEAMVDPDIELVAVTIDGKLRILTPEEVEEKKKELGEEKIKIEKTDIPEGFAKGKLITLTADEALRFKLASHKVSKIEEILPLYGLDGASLVSVSITWSENVVRFLTHPIVSGLLLSLGMLGLVFELRIPGWGVSGTIGLLCLALFFGAHYLSGMAGWAKVTIPLLFFLGVTLLLLEILVIPGFGIAGIGGIVFIVASIFLTLVKHPLPTFPGAGEEWWQALYTLSISVISLFVIAILSFLLIPQSNLWKKIRHRVVLTSKEEAKSGFRGTPSTWENFMGREGKALSTLRPAGRAVFGEDILDVVTEGEFINQDTQVRVVKVEGNRIVVGKADRGES